MRWVEKFLFDTGALLAFLNGGEGSAEVKELIDRVEEGSVEGFISAITLAELGAIYTRSPGFDLADRRILQIRNSKLTTIALNAEIAAEAGREMIPGISFHEAIIAASALAVGASVVTGNRALERMCVPVTLYGTGPENSSQGTPE